MKERPILMSAPMVQAILREMNPKSQTRRVFRVKCDCGEDFAPEEMSSTTPEGWQTMGHSGRWWCACCSSGEVNCPYGTPGDRLWVKETFCCVADDGAIWYRATDEHKVDDVPFGVRWTPSIFMPRDYSRILLEVTGLRVERVRDISAADALAEGVVAASCPGNYIAQFEELWDSINAKRGFGWDVNPWVWVVSFRRLKP